MADAKVAEIVRKAREGRSPAYPFIGLQEALRRAEEFRKTEGKHLVPLLSAYRAWGIGEKTGNARQIAAALGHFGLFSFEGNGENRQARLTSLALNILLDTREISPERDAFTQEAALKPAIHKEMYEKWKSDLPSISTIETHLMRDRGFSRSGALALVDEYKDTLVFAKFVKPAQMPDVSDGNVPDSAQKPEPEVGDLIQVEVGGALALEKPSRRAAKSVAPGARQEVIALDEGDVVLTFPENLSVESYRDLEDHLQLFLRKAKRRAALEKRIQDCEAEEEER